jgi:hypothetical protein
MKRISRTRHPSLKKKKGTQHRRVKERGGEVV